MAALLSPSVLAQELAAALEADIQDLRAFLESPQGLEQPKDVTDQIQGIIAQNITLVEDLHKFETKLSSGEKLTEDEEKRLAEIDEYVRTNVADDGENEEENENLLQEPNRITGSNIEASSRRLVESSAINSTQREILESIPEILSASMSNIDKEIQTDFEQLDASFRQKTQEQLKVEMISVGTSTDIIEKDLLPNKDYYIERPINYSKEIQTETTKLISVSIGTEQEPNNERTSILRASTSYKDSSNSFNIKDEKKYFKLNKSGTTKKPQKVYFKFFENNNLKEDLNPFSPIPIPNPSFSWKHVQNLENIRTDNVTLSPEKFSSVIIGRSERELLQKIVDDSPELEDEAVLSSPYVYNSSHTM